MKTVNLDQRSPDWLVWRNTGLGSSDAAAIVGVSPWTDPLTLWRAKVAAVHGGKRPPGKADNSAMARGRKLEPHARSLYERLMGWPAPDACGVHDDHDWLKASCDGYNAERGVVVEIKAPNKDDHTLAVAGQVPEKYVPQCHHLLLVTGAKVLHYVSYSNYFPPHQQLVVVEVPRDEAALAALFEAERAFWGRVLDRTPPDGD